jgi:hypothetical protein
MHAEQPSPPTDAELLPLSIGYRVDAPEGRLGVVVDVRCSLDTGEANALVVADRSSGRLLVVPVFEVDRVVYRARLVVLRESPYVETIAAPERGRPHLRLLQGGLVRA